jgi:hypothetical protein
MKIRHWRTEKACCGLTSPNTESSAKNVEFLSEETWTKKYVVSTVKHGGLKKRGSLLVWGCFSFAGVGDLVKIAGIMRKENDRTMILNTRCCKTVLVGKEEEGTHQIMAPTVRI